MENIAKQSENVYKVKAISKIEKILEDSGYFSSWLDIYSCIEALTDIAISSKDDIIHSSILNKFTDDKYIAFK